eukprot:m.61156 g.61156  ORF g.61156 m.61156 type:complete len:70 (+) comp11849_c0_seq3:961-1170(+)
MSKQERKNHLMKVTAALRLTFISYRFPSIVSDGVPTHVQPITDVKQAIDELEVPESVIKKSQLSKEAKC